MGVGLTRNLVILDSSVSDGAEIESALCADVPGARIACRGTTLTEVLGATESDGVTCAVVHLDEACGEEMSTVVSALRARDAAVVCIIAESQIETRLTAVAAGAAAVVNDDVHPTSLSIAVMTALDGGTWIPSDLVEASLRSAPPVHLSGQEQRALGLYASGMTLGDVAAEMDITPNTAKHYLDRVRDKYTAVGFPSRSKVELHRIARLEGLLP